MRSLEGERTIQSTCLQIYICHFQIDKYTFEVFRFYSRAQSLITLGDSTGVAVVEQHSVALGQGYSMFKICVEIYYKKLHQ